MPGRESAALFRRDPLAFLDQQFPAAGDTLWLPGRQLCVAEPSAARAILTNADGLYQEHSDFFNTERGMLGPRSAQIAIGRGARTLLNNYLAAHTRELAALLRQTLVPTSAWPDAGNWLIYRHLAPALLSPASPARLRRTIDEVVERAVLAGARQRSSRLRRAVFRYRVSRELAQAVTDRRACGVGEPADLLDVVAGSADAATPAAELAEVFLSFVFAVAGSVGFTLGWSLYLLASNPPSSAEPAAIVREALRLWPVAWMLGRRPAQAHEVAGVTVTPRNLVIVCPYLVHRHPRYWNDPRSFRPERWAAFQDHQAFMPFGSGPHTCAAAALSIQLVADVLRLLEGYRLTLIASDDRPCVGPALAPPRFNLGLLPI